LDSTAECSRTFRAGLRGGLRRRVGAIASEMISGGLDQLEDAPVASDRRPKKAKRSKGAVKRPAPSLDDRLAAFGEAFMGSIEGPPLRTQRKAGSRSPVVSPLSDPPHARPSKRRRKSRPGSQDAEVPAASSPAKPPATAARPPASCSAASGAPQERPAAAAASRTSAAPPRMSAAEKRRFMSGKVSEIRSKGASGAGKSLHGGQSEEDREFRQTLREVLDFVTPKLGKEEQRQYEEAKIRALGGTVEKRNKMPYRLLQIKQKERAEQRRQQLEEEKYLGVSMSANQHRNGREVDKLLRQKKEAIKEKKRRREDGLLRLGMGARESRGMAIISSSALRARGKRRR